jgi:hypothetical protein
MLCEVRFYLYLIAAIALWFMTIRAFLMQLTRKSNDQKALRTSHQLASYKSMSVFRSTLLW